MCREDHKRTDPEEEDRQGKWDASALESLQCMISLGMGGAGEQWICDLSQARMGATEGPILWARRGQVTVRCRHISHTSGQQYSCQKKRQRPLLFVVVVDLFFKIKKNFFNRRIIATVLWRFLPYSHVTQS